MTCRLIWGYKRPHCPHNFTSFACCNVSKAGRITGGRLAVSIFPSGSGRQKRSIKPLCQSRLVMSWSLEWEGTSNQTNTDALRSIVCIRVMNFWELYMLSGRTKTNGLPNTAEVFNSSAHLRSVQPKMHPAQAPTEITPRDGRDHWRGRGVFSHVSLSVITTKTSTSRLLSIACLMGKLQTVPSKGSPCARCKTLTSTFGILKGTSWSQKATTCGKTINHFH